jgi:hypothetical protein
MARYSSASQRCTFIWAIGVKIRSGSKFLSVCAVESGPIMTVALLLEKPLSIVKVLRLQRGFIRGSGLTKPLCTKGRKRHTALDTFDLVLRVVVTAANVPEREASKQVLSFGLPDGTKGFTAVYGQTSLSLYPLPLFIQPLRLGPNQPALRPIALPATSIDILAQLPNCKFL